MNQKGQLLLPMLALMVLFAVFFGAYLRWCHHLYWQMRMDITAEAVALSAARAQAQMLNNLATMQTAGNVFVQKVGVGDIDVGHVQVIMKTPFELYVKGLKLLYKGYLPFTMMVANQVAKANRADDIALPWPKPNALLDPHSVFVSFWYGIYPTPMARTYDNVYYVRSWKGNLHNPQPTHQNAWAVTRQGIVGVASAKLWLDVAPSDSVANGGFPRLNGSPLENIGIQCFYPHFNARLAPTSLLIKNVITPLAKALSAHE